MRCFSNRAFPGASSQAIEYLELDPSQDTNLLLEIEVLLILHLQEDFQDAGSGCLACQPCARGLTIRWINV
ncbi:hypothetical protein APB70_26395 [Pseudomonas aeruginosa]|nr:hypothetical protein EG09_07440 [Pseudomonas aeruginosa]AKE69358.1 hypothetical protein YQ19_14420 [Pseudomonas aeruginosa]ALY39458.1 hypothetical protein HW09_00835 [Pseudomonas aeruginosa]ARG51634.1 hypothetical protein BFV99_20520 [Pseudomonas aeruginosa]AVE32930.1 hypothetical protein HV91_12385 [Pseudomonas aeruginosa]